MVPTKMSGSFFDPQNYISVYEDMVLNFRGWLNDLLVVMGHYTSDEARTKVGQWGRCHIS